MSSPIGLRTGQTSETHSTSAASGGHTVTLPARGADYAYRIAAVTAGLILLATVM
jgi:hypothetical protein